MKSSKLPKSISLEELLGRPQNAPDAGAVQPLIKGAGVLVTGAGGSIGAELAQQIAALQPSELILLEISEFNLYQIERGLRANFPALKLSALLCDVRDNAHIERIFARHTPDHVFHAAAIKHVPLAEGNAEETILTNVFGTRCVAEACIRHAAKNMVMLSTDKAVNPVNVMGASKRLAEDYCQSLSTSSGKTKFITVRFGNVLGSTGSVVPLFIEQIEKGGPITVTHPDMKRYFMTLREAVGLVLQAAAMGSGLFVFDMGPPVPITDLARQMIRLSGFGERDIAIAYSGLRPGEKLYEELFHFSENPAKTSHESILLASARFTDLAALRTGLDALYAACNERKAGEALALLKKLVPEYKPSPK